MDNKIKCTHQELLLLFENSKYLHLAGIYGVLKHFKKLVISLQFFETKMHEIIWQQNNSSAKTAKLNGSEY